MAGGSSPPSCNKIPAQTVPQLPFGKPNTISGLSETFAFHSSPEAFLSKRIFLFNQSAPDGSDSRATVRAKVLNRDVAVISSYKQIVQVLNDSSIAFDPGNEDPAFVATAAYNKLMGPFFPGPNLLLMDGATHAVMREEWDTRMKGCAGGLQHSVRASTEAHFDGIVQSGGVVGLYESMKALAWRILLGAFLGLKPEDEGFATIERLQEELLRGQFSLFPVSVNAGLWHSPRKRGIKAKEKLQEVLREKLRAHGLKACPVARPDPWTEESLQGTANHVLLFTSSLAVKALASLLTAVFLNLYIRPLQEPEVRSQLDDRALSHIVLETERLSPPVVGIMRRATRDVVLSTTSASPDVLIPTGWDAWLYFVGGGRDPEAFGDDCDIFKPDRYSHADTPPPLAFGAGAKNCLGQDFMRRTVVEIARTCLDMNLTMTGEVTAPGVQVWLGWACSSSLGSDGWAADVKQLPVQHPARPIMVNFSR